MIIKLHTKSLCLPHTVMQYTEGNQENTCGTSVLIWFIFALKSFLLQIFQLHAITPVKLSFFLFLLLCLEKTVIPLTVFPYRSLFYGDLPVQIKREATGMKLGHRRCWDASKSLGHKSRERLAMSSFFH